MAAVALAYPDDLRHGQPLRPDPVRYDRIKVSRGAVTGIVKLN
jgi:hypothetical protein